MDKLRVGIAGCGKMSHFHRTFVNSYPDATLCALADRNTRLLRKMGAKYGIRNCYTDIEEMIDKESTDVVHIVTSPETRAETAALAIGRNNHVYIENPMITDHRSAVRLYDMAARHNVRICVGQNQLFNPCMVAAKDIFKTLDFNGISYVECYYGIKPGISETMEYRKNNDHSSGSFIQHYLGDPLCTMLEYTGKPLHTEIIERSETLVAYPSDELHVMVYGEQAIGKLIVSFKTGPLRNLVRIYHKKAIITIDLKAMTVVVDYNADISGLAPSVPAGAIHSKNPGIRTISGLHRFMTDRLEHRAGMRNLIHGFYDSIRSGSQSPVLRDSVLDVLKVIDGIRVKKGNFHPLSRQTAARRSFAQYNGRVLVTGAGGFLGRRLTEMLLEKKYLVRILVPKTTDIGHFERLGIDVQYGNPHSDMAFAEAIDGMDYVIHAAGAQPGDSENPEASIQGTEKIMRFSRQLKVRRVIYIGSMAVYQKNGVKPGSLVKEDDVLEQNPESRGADAYSSLQAENMIRSLMAVDGSGKIPAVILRPAIIYGPDCPLLDTLSGISIFKKFFLVFGKKKMKLPLVYIDNLIDAIIACMENDSASGHIFNVIDDNSITKKEFLRKLASELFPSFYAVSLPCCLARSLIHIQEIVSKMMKRDPFFSRYALSSVYTDIKLSNEKIKKLINWYPRVSPDEALSRTFQWFKENRPIIMHDYSMKGMKWLS